MSTPPPRPRPLRQRLAALTRKAVGGEGAAAADADPRIEILVGSPLFDHAWYAMLLRREMSRPEAAKHYLSVAGRGNGLTPSPLIVPEYYAPGFELDDELKEDPFVVYLSERRFDVEVHPLFEVARYLEQFPEAAEHSEGPIGHYRDHGAAQGARVNDWYRPTPDEPRGLVDWLWRDASQWAERNQLSLPTWGRGRAKTAAKADMPAVEDARIGTTTVVLVAEHGKEALARSLNSVLAQTASDWELVVLGLEHGVELDDYPFPEDGRIRLVPGVSPNRWHARNKAIELARGTHVAWMVEGDEWLRGRLSSIHAALVQSGSRWVHDCARDERPNAARRHAARQATHDRLQSGHQADLGTLVVERDLLADLGGFDLTLRGGQVLDLLLRLDAHEQGGFAPRLGVKVARTSKRDHRTLPANHRPLLDFDRLEAAGDVVLNSHLVDWAELASRSTDPGLVSVIVPTNHDWKMTQLAVQRVIDADGPTRVEVVVVDNGCPVVASAVLGSLPERFANVTVVRSPVNHGFALGNNLGLRHVAGGTVVFLNNDTEVQSGWLAPLLESLSDEQVLGAQSLLIYPDGAIQSAGVVFPRGGGIPHVLLQGFPVEDAAGMGSEPLHALTGAALAIRHRDVVALHGFDPVFRNGMEDVDLCLRLAELRPGHFVVRPDSQVVHHESRSPGRFTRSLVNRRVLLGRWAGRLPEDDVEAWGRRGYNVTGHVIQSRASPDQRLCVAEPVLARHRRLQVEEGLPALRWALKNPAPAGPEGERWGDTHFARQLARALRHLGQDVVIDHRGEHKRQSGWLDEVVLLLRGVAPYTPMLDRVNLMWLISHPDMVEREEHIGWDRVYVASVSFARTLAEEWGAPAVPLLQATDPSVFNPDCASPDTGPRALFVGNSRGQARPLVMWAVERDLPLTVIGSGWEELIPARYVKSRFLANAELGAAYRASGLVLNDHWHDMRTQGFLSNRLFDAVAAGARVVTDDATGIEEVFGDGVQVVRSAAELAELVNADDLDAVFGSDEVRRERAARITAEHSFAARARLLIEDAARIRAARGYP